MFDNLSMRMEKAWKSISKDGKLTPENIKEPIREIRRALLEADVSLPVVRRFVKKVEEQALGKEVITGVTPDVQFVKVVNDELVELMGKAGSKDLEPGLPQVVLMAGLQGVGKTTACGKLALFLKKREKKVLMVATDVYRPAAIDQLVKLGSKIDVPVFELGTDVNPVEIAKRGVAEARDKGYDAVIVDTAGRLQVDQDMMNELKEIKAAVRPTDTLLVVDAMTGQEAASLVKTFNDEVDITGAILTKMDGDSRGGAALSVREVSGKPIKFVGVGEKMESLELFYPERMAGRILGMGDMLTLFEKAQEAIKEDEAAAMAERIKAEKFDVNDFMKAYKQINNLGGLQMMKMMPGMNQISEKQLYVIEKEMKVFESIINSMTNEEREMPDILISSPSRRRRIARGSGRTEKEVGDMLAKFMGMRQQMQRFGKMMKLSQPGGAEDQKLMQELIDTTAVKVAKGKVRRKKEKVPKDKSRGFGTVKV